MSLLNQFEKTISIFLLMIPPNTPLMLSQLPVHICAIRPIIFKLLGQPVIR